MDMRQCSGTFVRTHAPEQRAPRNEYAAGLAEKFVLGLEELFRCGIQAIPCLFLRELGAYLSSDEWFVSCTAAGDR